MFRPNRIGTPTFHSSAKTTSTADLDLAQEALTGTTFPFTVINATPVADVGRSTLLWTGAAAEAVTGARRFMLVQQFTVTEPLNGDAVGVELNASIVGPIPQCAWWEPVLFKMTAALGTIGASGNAADTPQTLHGPAILYSSGQLPTVETLTWQQRAYRDQVVYLGAAGSIAGTYAHGFRCWGIGPTNWSLTTFHMTASVRQLNDQQSVGYRDTLR